ncbi:MAG TPA: glycosyltransferase family 1 protein [Thermoleophilaceae bacterium]|jgi:glycosyltransferase involved in cell wall biosynthesis
MARPLNVGLNLVYLLEQSGGAGTYARELMRGILEVEPDTRLTGFVSAEAPESLLAADWARSVEWVKFPFNVSHGPPGNFALVMGAQWGAVPLIAARRRIDVVHGLANITPLVAPRVATVVTLLDLIWLRFTKTMERRATVGMKLVALPSARRADRVIAISHSARRDLIERIDLPPERVDVTHLGIRLDETVEPLPEAELRARFELGDRPVVLCVAQKREHKNLKGLVRAFAALEEPATLVFPGAPTPYEEEMKALAAELGVAERVRFPGWIERDELEGLYSAAACFVLPSFEEGFGLPILEAMRRGVPVACSNTSSLPEVAGDDALLFDPEKPEEIADAVGRLLRDRDLAARLAERGVERCHRFTWESTARETLAVYRRAIASARS